MDINNNNDNQIILKIIKMAKKLISYEILTWVFFASQGIEDLVNLMRCEILCIELERQRNAKIATIESIKNSSAYLGCIYDIPDSLITDAKIQEMIDFKLN